MKLYATTTSERASKGQGGNNHLYIDIVNEFKQPILSVIIEKGVLDVIHQPVYQMQVRNWIDNKTTTTIIKDTKCNCGNCKEHTSPQIKKEIKEIQKGKSQKGKSEEHYGQHIENGISYCADCEEFED